MSVTRALYWDSTDFTFLVVNDGSRTLNVDFSNMLVNGEEDFPWFYQTVYPGTKAIGVLSINDDSLAELGFDTLESLAIEITVYDDDTYEEVAMSDGFIDLPVGLG